MGGDVDADPDVGRFNGLLERLCYVEHLAEVRGIQVELDSVTVSGRFKVLPGFGDVLLDDRLFIPVVLVVDAYGMVVGW